MENLKKITKEVFFGVAFFVCMTLGIFFCCLVITRGDILKIFTDFSNLFNGSYAYKNYAILLSSLAVIPMNVIVILIRAFRLARLLIDSQRQEVVESVIYFYAKTNPIEFESGRKKGVLPQKYTLYRGRDLNNKRITLTVFPDVFNYEGNMSDKKFNVKYYKYSKVAIEIVRDKTQGTKTNQGTVL